MRDFAIGNMADDLVKLTLELCGKTEEKTPRFPRLFYPSYVTRIIDTALDIQENIFEANEIRIGAERLGCQRTATEKCVYLNHLVRVANELGYISEKQRDRWQKLTTSLKWGIVAWIKSDAERARKGAENGGNQGLHDAPRG